MHLSALMVLVLVGVLTPLTSAAIHALSNADKNHILDKHNTYRQAQPAASMPDLTWSDDLAKLAQAWTDKCGFSHQSGKPWGENIAAKSARSTTNTAAIDYMINLWTAEDRYNTDGSFSCCGNSAHRCCHLTQLFVNLSCCGRPSSKCRYLTDESKNCGCSFGPCGRSSSKFCHLTEVGHISVSVPLVLTSQSGESYSCVLLLAAVAALQVSVDILQVNHKAVAVALAAVAAHLISVDISIRCVMKLWP
ncbi:venom allergen 5 [Plakobranchus ocellatus]|uniref:Venom allergen 5 n=1 Tax=Plakobranchus ocellatus TaxID=259542 RepID=A0AAV4CJS0_9GAST|nr:venom allergen 5 [Plakobranchus ocellatus]